MEIPKTVDLTFEKIPLTRLAATVLSVVSLLTTVSISYATYKEQFAQVKQALERQETINDANRTEIWQLQLSIARLQVSLDKNTEALINVSKR